VDAIQEFKVHTNSLSAEFGRTGGGVLNFIFKSGTNQLHGSFLNFCATARSNANNFLTNRAGVPLASFSRHKYGGTLGDRSFATNFFTLRVSKAFVNRPGLRRPSQCHTSGAGR